MIRLENMSWHIGEGLYVTAMKADGVSYLSVIIGTQADADRRHRDVYSREEMNAILAASGSATLEDRQYVLGKLDEFMGWDA